MKYLPQVFTEEQCKALQKFWADNNKDRSVVNWEEDGKVLDRRLRIMPKDPEYNFVKPLIDRFFKLQPTYT